MGQRGRRVKKAPIDVTKIDPSRYQLFNDNIHIAYEIAKKFYPKPLLFEDAIQTAQEGLWKACLNFDESKGFAFSTLAYRTVSNTLIRTASKEAIQEHDYFISLDAEISGEGSDDSTNLENLLVYSQSDTANQLFESFDADELTKLLDKIIKNKSKEDQELFKYLKDGRDNNEIKEDLGITRNRVSKFKKELIDDLYNYGYFSDKDFQKMK